MNKEIDATLQDKPKISKYRLKRPYIPPHLRDQSDEKEKVYYKTRKEIEDLKECTFTPNIKKDKYNSKINSSVENLIKWGEEKNLRLCRAQLKSMLPDPNEPNHSPQISERSKKIAKKLRKGDKKSTEERLMKYGSEKSKRLKKLKKQLNKELFKPKIGFKSMRIVERKRNGDKEFETLCKEANGKTVNLDFFYARPKSALPKKRKSLYFKENPDLSERSLIKLESCEKKKSRSKSPFSNRFNVMKKSKRKRRKSKKRREKKPLIKSFLLKEIEKTHRRKNTPIIKGILKKNTPSTRSSYRRGKSAKSIRFKGLEGDVSEFWLDEDKGKKKRSKVNVRNLTYRDNLIYDRFGNLELR